MFPVGDSTRFSLPFARLTSLPRMSVPMPVPVESDDDVTSLTARYTAVTEEAIRQRARESILQSKADVEVDRFLRQMREEAFVELRLEG